jgi:hypothetical protein
MGSRIPVRGQSEGQPVPVGSASWAGHQTASEEEEELGLAKTVGISRCLL